MSNSTSAPCKNIRPTLLIDFRLNRIRVHKKTLKVMGNPSYIQFLINPQNQSLVICNGMEKDPLTQKINWKKVTNGRCCEFYSKHLVETIKEAFFPESENLAYRFYGEVIEAESIIFFSLLDPVPFTYKPRKKKDAHYE